MSKGSLATLVLAIGATTLLQAQAPHFGCSLNLNIPTGDFASHTIDATYAEPFPKKETYDIGLGGQFTASFPIDPHVAFRLEVFGQSENGRNHADGYADLKLRHQLVGFWAMAAPTATAACI
jgi:hypothetical protein